jgi:RHS repeat-associated protein
MRRVWFGRWLPQAGVVRARLLRLIVLVVPATLGVLFPGSALAVGSPDGCGDQSLGAGRAGAIIWADQVSVPGGTTRGIWTMNADGTNPHAIAVPGPGSGGDDATVALSPSGNQIAYSCGGHVYVMDSDGSNAQQLAPGGGAADGGAQPTFSPTGSQIAFIQGTPGAANIYTVSTLGGIAHAVTSSAPNTFQYDMPSWGPTNLIAFSGGSIGCVCGTTYSLWTVSPNGGATTQITFPFNSNDWSPNWSPDGSTLAFFHVYYPGSGAVDDIYKMPSAGGASTQLTFSGTARFPVYSHDGSSIFYMDTSLNALMSIPAGGGTSTQVSQSSVVHNQPEVEQPGPARSVATQAGTLNSYFWKTNPLPLSEVPVNDDPIKLDVSLANGNLVASQRDLNIAGTGMPLTVERYFNSMQGSSGDLGNGWLSNQGGDIRLVATPDGQAMDYYGPSGFVVTFTKSGGSFTAPAGLDQSLVLNGDGTYTLTDSHSGEKYNFNNAGQLTSHADKNGNKLSYAYTSGILSSITDTQGRQITVSSSGGRITGMSDPTGRSIGYGYDGSGNLTTFTDANNGQTKFGYDANGRLTQLTDPDTNVTNITYQGSSAQVASITRITNPTAGTGDTTAYGYSTAPTTGPCSGLATATTVTDANGHTATYCFDSQGREVLKQDALGNQTSWTYNADGHATQMTLPSGAVTTYGFDANNNLTSVQEPTGATTRWLYADSIHPFYPTQLTDAQGNVTHYAYDTPGNLMTITDANNKQTILAYNPNGTLASATDRNTNRTSYGYDTKGNLTSITPPSPLGAETITPDALSRVGQIKDGKNQIKTFSYDPLDDVTQVVNGTTTIGYVYDAAGNQKQETDPTGTTTFTWDAKDRLSQATFPGNKIVGYGYDGADNLTSLTDASGTVQYGYDNANRLNSLTDPNNANTTFGYNTNSSRTTTSYPNGVTLTDTYAADSGGHATPRLASITARNSGGTTLKSSSYSYLNGSTDTDLRQSITDAANNVTAYTYDPLNRLGEAKTTNGGSTTADYKYTYDPVGNRLSAINGAATTTYTYNAANELCWSISGTSTNACSHAPHGATSYSYDADGNQTTDSASTLAYAYNGLNQTTSITPHGGSALTMAYRGSAQADRANAGTSSFINSELGMTSATTGTATTYYTRDAAGNLISERTPTGTYYYIPDGLGSTIGLADATGALANTYQYDPYGNTTSSSGTVTNPWRYTGQYQDSTTGLYKIGERYYNPGLPRWSQEDSIVNFSTNGQDNRYQYAASEPITLTDPTGLSPSGSFLDDFVNGVGSIGSAVGNGASYAFHREVGGFKAIGDYLSSLTDQERKTIAAYIGCWTAWASEAEPACDLGNTYNGG